MPDLAAVRTVNGSPAPRASAGPVRAGTPAMRALLLLGAMLLLGGVLLLLSPVLVRADTGLTSAIANAYFLRTVDENLHSIAHQRAAELAACNCLSHSGMRSGTAEVIAYNVGMPNPVGEVVNQWIGSPGHNALLSDTSYGKIGCAEVVSGGTHWFACVLAKGPLPAPVAAPPAAILIDLPAAPPASQPAAEPSLDLPPPDMPEPVQIEVAEVDLPLPDMPAPVRITARTSSAADAWATAASSPWTCSRSRALRRSGRSMVMVATAPSTS